MNAETLDFNKNEDALRLAVSGWRTRLDKIALGGGKTAIEKQREKNKLTARERIQYLIDEGSVLSSRSAPSPDLRCMKNKAAAPPVAP